MTEITTATVFNHAVPADAMQVDALSPVVAEQQARGRYDDLLAIRRSIHARMQRGRFFNSRLFADPAWDMLLELYAAALTQRRLPISRLADRAGVPMTTALRWINTLESEGLVERQPDRLDGRRVFITLSNKGVDAMAAYMDGLPENTKLL